MPAPIDVEQRLDEIAVATLELAREGGAAAVTIRAVAARLGGATSRVTKYLPTRAGLLANAARYMTAHWEADAGAALADQTGIDRLRALAAWSLTTDGYDDAIRRLWIDAIASGQTEIEGVNHVREQAHHEQDELRALVEDALPAGNEWLADALYLAFRGYYLSTIEDPHRWPAERAGAAIQRLLDLVESRGG